MVRIVGFAFATVFLVAGCVAVYLYDRVVTLHVATVSKDVSVIRGLGGNVGVLRTDDGVVVVDTMTFAIQGRQIRELAERIAGGATRAVINTHYHQDHTHGNPGFAAGTRVVSTRRTLDYLNFFDPDYWQGGREGTLPNLTFDGRHQLLIGGKNIRLHHFGRGHTGGDLVVDFVDDRVIHTGDLFFNHQYPRIDLAGGGSVPAWVATLDAVLELDFDHVIPGHGAVSDRESLRAFRDFLADLWEQTEAAVAAGKDLDATLASVHLRHDGGYEVVSIPFVLTRDRDSAITSAWQEASGTVLAAEVPASYP
jgi:glyoxylase-like metal-dependent hydrolase (beta-lactamase superfamily II)